MINSYWLIALVISWLTCIVGGWEAATWKQEDKQKSATIVAQNNARGVEHDSDIINNDIETWLLAQNANTTHMYSVPATSSGNMPKVSRPATGTNARCISKQYHLSLEQCDFNRTQVLGFRKAWKETQAKFNQ